MANTKRLRAIRRRLWEANPHCHYCGIETIWHSSKHNETLPDNAATIDHVISRLDPRRYLLPYYPSSLFVLACSRCNHERGAREDTSLRQKVQWNSREHLKEILLTNPEFVVQL